MEGMWKTEICKFNLFPKGCRHEVCAFAHSFAELRHSHNYVEKKGVLDRMAKGQATSEDQVQLRDLHEKDSKRGSALHDAWQGGWKTQDKAKEEEHKHKEDPWDVKGDPWQQEGQCYTTPHAGSAGTTEWAGHTWAHRESNWAASAGDGAASSWPATDASGGRHKSQGGGNRTDWPNIKDSATSSADVQAAGGRARSETSRTAATGGWAADNQAAGGWVAGGWAGGSWADGSSTSCEAACAASCQPWPTQDWTGQGWFDDKAGGQDQGKCWGSRQWGCSGDAQEENWGEWQSPSTASEQADRVLAALLAEEEPTQQRQAVEVASPAALMAQETPEPGSQEPPCPVPGVLPALVVQEDMAIDGGDQATVNQSGGPQGEKVDVPAQEDTEPPSILEAEAEDATEMADGGCQADVPVSSHAAEGTGKDVPMPAASQQKKGGTSSILKSWISKNCCKVQTGVSIPYRRQNRSSRYGLFPWKALWVLPGEILLPKVARMTVSRMQK